MKKYIIGFLIIVVVGAAVIWGAQYYRYRTSPEYQALKYFQDLERQYAEDTYGGDTPEETLRLFIEALEKGDMELASKYFLIEDQPKEKERLTNLDTEQKLILIQEIKKDLNEAEKIIEENRVIFQRTEKVENGFIEWEDRKILIPQGNYLQTTTLIKNKNSKWKISEL